MPVIAGLALLPMAVASLASCLSDPRAQRGLWRHVRMGWAIIGGLVVTSMIFSARRESAWPWPLRS